MIKTVKRLNELKKIIEEHNYNYYVLDKPLISDYDFDIKLKELIGLENQYPQFSDINSPSKRVGGVVIKTFNTTTHDFPMYSLDNSYSKNDLEDLKRRS